MVPHFSTGLGFLLFAALFRKWKNTLALSDAELLAEYRQTQDTFYFGELYKRYTHQVYGICLNYFKDREQGKDAVMQIFEQLMTDLKTRQVDNFKHWLCVVSKNHCLMALRKKNAFTPLENQAELMENEDHLHLVLEKEETLQQLEEGLQNIPAEQQTCIRLFYLQELSDQQISAQTGYELNKIKSYIQNGKRNLKIILLKQHGEQND